MSDSQAPMFVTPIDKKEAYVQLTVDYDFIGPIAEIRGIT